MNGRIMGMVVLGLLFISMLAASQAGASGPKSIYGTLYVGGQVAGAGVDVKIRIDNQTFTKKTFSWNTCNYIIGLPPGYEGKTAYFYVGGSSVVPLDNSSFIVGGAIEYLYDLHVPNVTSNPAPTAVIDSISPNPAWYNQTVRFVGHGTDPNGFITAYQWRSSLMIGNLSVNQSFNRSSLPKGNHTIFFRVRDNNNTWSPEVSQTLRVTHYNRLAKATIDSILPKRARVGTNVSFKGHGNDSDGSISGYSWRSNRTGVFGSKASFNYSALPLGNHTVYFKVLDNASYWSDEVQSWVLIVENLPPVARINGPTQVEVGTAVQFDGTTSTDPDGTIRSWFWEFGDGTNSSVSQPTHSYSEVRSYVVRLTVTDDAGAKANNSMQVEVVGIVIEEDIIFILNDVEGPLEGSADESNSFTFTATHSELEEEFYFFIDWGDGKKTTTEFTTSGRPVTVNHSWEEEGSYTIEVRAFDLNYIPSNTKTHEIEIIPVPPIIDLWLVALAVIIIVSVVLAIFLLKRRKRTPQQTPMPMTMNETPAEDYPYYEDQPLEPIDTPLAKPMKQPSGFKRL